MSKRADGGLAFPTDPYATPGMSLRDYFAGQALQGYAANQQVMEKAIKDWDQNGGSRPI